MVVGVEAAAGESGCIARFFEFGTDAGRLQDRARLVDHVLRNQNTAGQDAERTFHHAHVLIDHQVFDAGNAISNPPTTARLMAAAAKLTVFKVARKSRNRKGSAPDGT